MQSMWSIVHQVMRDVTLPSSGQKGFDVFIYVVEGDLFVFTYLLIDQLYYWKTINHGLTWKFPLRWMPPFQR